MKHIIIKGINEDNTCLCAIVEASSIEAARVDLIECMGIEAANYTEYVEALQLIGFTVITDIDDIKNIVSCEALSIPINLNKDNDIF